MQVTKSGDHKARMTWEASQFKADRDFVALYSTSRDRVGATLFAHEEKDGKGAFLLLLAPSEEAGKIVEKDVVFVVDTSGSMAGEKIEQTRRSLKYCINSLRKGDRFEIVSFATEAAPLFNSLKPVDDESRKGALAHVKGLEAVGGTNINDALLHALKLTRSKDRPFMIIFMTDGEPTIGVTTTEAIRRNVKKANEALTRLFVFGIGDGVRTELLDLLAEDNHGARDYVGNKEDIEVKISSFFRKVSSPVLSDVKVRFEGVSTSDVYPRPLPDLFRGSQLLLTGRYAGGTKGKVVLSGQVLGERFEQSFPVNFESRKSTAFVPRLWAVRKVGYLMDQIRLNGHKPELKDEIVRLGKRYGIVTPYTSYLVLEDSPVAHDQSRRWSGGRRRGGGNRVRTRFGRPANSATPGSGGGGGTPGEARKKSALDTFLGALPKPKEEQDQGGKPGGRSGAGRPPVGSTGGGYLPPTGGRIPGRGRADRSTDKEAEKARAEESKKLKDAFDGSTITLSQSLKALRTSTRSGSTGILVKRVGNRTFYLRQNHYVEAELLDVDAKALETRLITIEAYSQLYFDLLKGNPQLGKVLALGDRILFANGKDIVRIIPAKPKPAKTGTPGK